MTIHDAATVVLIRDSLEIFFLKRAASHDFMANRWVYPGGRIDPRDQAPELRAHVDDPGLLEGTLGALRVTALRETFEESGLLLAHGEGAAPFAADAATLRQAVDEGTLGLAEVCAELGLKLNLRALHFFAHWITPDFEPRRYDTRFFLARAPRLQVAQSASEESTAGTWLTATDALQACQQNELLLAPPTAATLEDLAGLHTIDEVMAWARAVRPEPILPILDPDADVPTLRLPRGRVMTLRAGWRTEARIPGLSDL